MGAGGEVLKKWGFWREGVGGRVGGGDLFLKSFVYNGYFQEAFCLFCLKKGVRFVRRKINRR